MAFLLCYCPQWCDPTPCFCVQPPCSDQCWGFCLWLLGKISNLITVILISIFCFFHLNFCCVGLPSHTFFFSFFSAGISNFQPFHWHLLLSASNSTHFQGYPEQFHLIYILWKVSLTDSSLSSDLPFQSLKHKLLCYLAILFPARILPEDKLLDSS